MSEAFEPRPEVRRELEEILARYPHKRAAILPVLHVIQRECGHVSAAAERFVAELLEIAPVKVHEVCTFYTMIHLEPVGRYNLQFCRTLSCALRGGEKLIGEACKRIGVGEHELSADGRFSIEGVECLGACGNAPVLQVNEDYHYDLDSARLARLLEELARK